MKYRQQAADREALRARLKELQHFKRLCEQYRREVIAKVIEIEARPETTYTVVESGRKLVLRSAEAIAYYKQWSADYTERIAVYEQATTKTAAELKTAERAEKATVRRRAPILAPVAIIAAMLILLALVPLLKPQITGKAVSQVTVQEYSDAFITSYRESTNDTWTVQQYSAGSVLKSVKVDGKLEGTGSALVYLEGRLLLNVSNKNVEEPVQPVLTAQAPENGTAAQTSESNTAGTPDSTDGTAPEPSTDPAAGLGAATGSVIQDISVNKKRFSAECVETCVLDEALQQNYTLSVVMEGKAKLTIDAIGYSVEQGGVGNATNMSLVNATLQNATNASMSQGPLNETTNATGMNATIIAENATQEPMQEFLWDSSKAKNGIVKDGQVYFDGEHDFEEPAEMQNFTFTNNTFTIDATVPITADAKGTIVSQFDYINGKYFEVMVSERGTVQFILSDSDSTILLDTSKAYADGQLHDISVSLNSTAALLAVDGVLEVRADASQLGDISSNASLSIGANAGFLDYMQQTTDNFKGAIKSFSMHYKEKGGSAP